MKYVFQVHHHINCSYQDHYCNPSAFDLITKVEDVDVKNAMECRELCLRYVITGIIFIIIISTASMSAVTLPTSTSEASGPASCCRAAMTSGRGARCPPAACPGGRTALTATSATSSARSRARTLPGGARAASTLTRRTYPRRPPATPSKS